MLPVLSFFFSCPYIKILTAINKENGSGKVPALPGQAEQSAIQPPQTTGRSPNPLYLGVCYRYKRNRTA